MHREQVEGGYRHQASSRHVTEVGRASKKSSARDPSDPGNIQRFSTPMKGDHRIEFVLHWRRGGAGEVGEPGEIE